MTIGTKVMFTYKTKFGTQRKTTLIISNDILNDGEISDEEIYERLCPLLKKVSLATLRQKNYIFAARNLLKTAPDATEIDIQKVTNTQSNKNDAGGAILILAILAFIVAVICFPLLVILGMHNKLFLKEFYNKYEGEEYKAFAKKYTYVGIGLYALVAILIAVDSIFKLSMLIGPAFGILFFGGIAYFVVSLLLIKKKFAPEGEKMNILETLKTSFKKKDKNEKEKNPVAKE